MKLDWRFRAASGEPPPTQTVTLNPIADTYLQANNPTRNQGTSSDLPVGELNNANGAVRRSLIKFDFSSIPNNSIITSATLSLFTKVDYSNNARKFQVYRVLQPWVENQATWKIRQKGSNWATAGAFGATDTEQTSIGFRDMTKSETINTYKDIVLDPTKIKQMITGGSFINNGFLLKADAENNDGYTFASSNNSSNKPKLVISYVVAVPTPTATPKITPTPKLTTMTISESFTGNGQIDASRLGWSGSVGTSVLLQSDKLAVSVPQGSTAVGGNNATVFPYINYQIPTIVGDFETTVDLAGINTTSGWEELKFAPGNGGSFSIRRNMSNSTETLEVWTSPNNVPSGMGKIASQSLPANSSPLRVKMARIGNEMYAYYYDGSSFIRITNVNYYPLMGNSSLPHMVVENGSPEYPATIGYFDNYYAEFSISGNNPTASPTASPLPHSPTPTPFVVDCIYLYQTHNVDFANCRNRGFARICFNKYTAQSQGCVTADRNDCTQNNTNAKNNILCLSGPTPKPVPTPKVTPHN